MIEYNIYDHCSSFSTGYFRILINKHSRVRCSRWSLSCIASRAKLLGHGTTIEAGRVPPRKNNPHHGTRSPETKRKTISLFLVPRRRRKACGRYLPTSKSTRSPVINLIEAPPIAHRGRNSIPAEKNEQKDKRLRGGGRWRKMEREERPREKGRKRGDRKRNHEGEQHSGGGESFKRPDVSLAEPEIPISELEVGASPD
ncbi:hypothetical protein KM043_016570 [Ampulex compressa]|nr:hypothetical protein KM043_016570 [Ampulex compressa]